LCGGFWVFEVSLNICGGVDDVSLLKEVFLWMVSELVIVKVIDFFISLQSFSRDYITLVHRAVFASFLPLFVFGILLEEEMNISHSSYLFLQGYEGSTYYCLISIKGNIYSYLHEGNYSFWEFRSEWMDF
jgi:hypothetical protein